MKIAILADTHFGVRNDSSVLLDNQQKFFDNIFFPTIESQNITTLIHLGDLVDRRKYINYVTLNKMKDIFLNKLYEKNITTYIIAGNHDTSFKNTNEVNSLALLLQEFSNITVFDNEPSTITVDNFEILLCPWLNVNNTDYSMKYIKNSTASYLMGHFEFQGYEMSKGNICEHGLNKDLFSQFEQIFSGHFHHPSEYGNIKYLGAPYEMTWTDYKGKRGFHIFDTETKNLEFVSNPYALFHKIEYEDEDLSIEDVHQLDFSALNQTFVKVLIKSKTNPYVFDTFIERIQQQNPCDLKVIDIQSTIDIAENIDWDNIPNSFDLMKQYVENINTKVDTEKVIKELQKLWNEAQAV